MQGDGARQRIFIASATGHLGTYRAAAVEVCHRLGLTPVLMEEFTPESPPPLTVCREKIKSCGSVVLLIAHRYGSRPPGEALGYTELEYEYAVQHGRQLHIFLIEEGFPWPPTEVDRGDDAAALARFVERVGGHTIRRFGDLAIFREDLMLALQRYAMVAPGQIGLREVAVGAETIPGTASQEVLPLTSGQPAGIDRPLIAILRRPGWGDLFIYSEELTLQLIELPWRQDSKKSERQ
ncbi:MAG: DUF4062 domain-containing protein [Pseudonocardiales bacterium]|nr:DUF4062 domain-containing protein [Pseudonocardiales bacterium]MBV9164371.1 DUF4062 domain-containing protein [Pseudonocardiales bacterium]